VGRNADADGDHLLEGEAIFLGVGGIEVGGVMVIAACRESQARDEQEGYPLNPLSDHVVQIIIRPVLIFRLACLWDVSIGKSILNECPGF